MKISSGFVKAIMILPWVALGCLVFDWLAPYGFNPFALGLTGAPFVIGYFVSTSYLCEFFCSE